MAKRKKCERCGKVLPRDSAPNRVYHRECARKVEAERRHGYAREYNSYNPTGDSQVQLHPEITADCPNATIRRLRHVRQGMEAQDWLARIAEEEREE